MPQHNSEILFSYVRDVVLSESILYLSRHLDSRNERKTSWVREHGDSMKFVYFWSSQYSSPERVLMLHIERHICGKRQEEKSFLLGQ